MTSQQIKERKELAMIETAPLWEIAYQLAVMNERNARLDESFRQFSRGIIPMSPDAPVVESLPQTTSEPPAAERVSPTKKDI